MLCSFAHDSAGDPDNDGDIDMICMQCFINK